MQRALRFVGDDVVTIFKGLQLDIGAPPQFMDFRYTVHDPWHGEFRLDHCGALMDVEPMGEEYVVVHVPRHRGPDVRRDRGGDQPAGAGAADPPSAAPCRPTGTPHCAWTVVIDERTRRCRSRRAALRCGLAGRRPRAGADRPGG